VRSEAAEAIGQCIGDSREVSETKKADAYVALIKLLEDSDGFVVSRAVAGLQGADVVAAVEPMVKAATAHPELAAEIARMMAESNKMRPKAVSHLRTFCSHAEPAVRAAAIEALCGRPVRCGKGA